MSLRTMVAITSLMVFFTTGHASAETVTVKDSQLVRVRAALTHYDLGPDGTLTVLGQLNAYADEHRGTNEGDEARFLRAAVASDLLFIADFTDDSALRDRVAQAVGVETDALRPTLLGALQACAHGIYRASAETVLSALQPDAPLAATQGVRDARTDALLLRTAMRPKAGTPLGAHFAALGQDPCPTAGRCPERYAGLDSQGRRALAFMERLGAAMRRLDNSARGGDPLAEALTEPLAALRRRLVELELHLPAQLAAAIPAAQGGSAWPAPEVLLFVKENEVRFARTPLAHIEQDGSVELVHQSGPVLPKTERLSWLRDLSRYTRPIDELVDAARALRGDAPELAAAVTLESGVPAHLVGRVLVSLKRAGIDQPMLLGRAADGGMVSVPLHVVFAGVDPVPPRSDLTLRVRLGGYTLSVGQRTLDIPRVRSDDGWQFDLATLRSSVAQRRAKSATVSFMGDVAAEQVLAATFDVPSKQPVEFIVQ